MTDRPLTLRERSLIRTKRRLTKYLVQRDAEELAVGPDIPDRRWLRTRIYRIDLLLDRRGLLPRATWYPAARRSPGLNANYRRGRVLARAVKEHFTVGTASLGLIRDKGLAQFLVNRDGTIDQCAPADAVCADSCEWCIEGPGIENESLRVGELNDAMIRANAGLHRWLHDTYGYPYTFHDGPRLAIGSGYRGFVNHGSLVHRACDQHSDGLTRAEWNAIVAALGGAAPAPPEVIPHKEPNMFVGSLDGQSWYLFSERWTVPITADEATQLGKTSATRSGLPGVNPISQKTYEAIQRAQRG